MQITEKLIKPLTETKYLNADNVDRYRCIMRIFFDNYEKLHYWMYQEDVYQEMIQNSYFADYRIEQCQQDLAMLTEWKNLNTIQDTRKVSSIEEFKNKIYKLAAYISRKKNIIFNQTMHDSYKNFERVYGFNIKTIKAETNIKSTLEAIYVNEMTREIFFNMFCTNASNLN